jgi:hypothetical protein
MEDFDTATLVNAVPTGWLTESGLPDFHELRQGFAKHPAGQPAEVAIASQTDFGF